MGYVTFYMRPQIAVIALAFVSVAQTGAEISDSTIRDFVTIWARTDCLARLKIPKVAILGFPINTEGLNDRQRDFVRSKIKKSLQDQFIIQGVSVNFVPYEKVDTVLLEYKENFRGDGNISAEAVRKKFSHKLSADVLVDFTIVRRTRQFVIFHIDATRVGEQPCEVAGGQVKVALPSRSLRTLSSELDRLSRALEDLEFHEVLVEVPRIGGSPYSDCGSLAQALIVEHLTRTLVPSAGRALRSSDAAPPVAIRKVDAFERAAPKAGRLVLSGRVVRTHSGGHALSLQAELAGNIVFTASGATMLHVACDMGVNSFLDHIREYALEDSRSISIYAEKNSFVVGRDELKVRIIVGERATRLYCWYLNPDETAFVWLPVPGQLNYADVKPPQEKTFPEDFSLPPQPVGNASRDMFGCFAPNGDVKPEVAKRWLAKHFTKGTGKQPLALDKTQIVQLLRLMRAQPGMAEAYAVIDIRGN